MIPVINSLKTEVTISNKNKSDCEEKISKFDILFGATNQFSHDSDLGRPACAAIAGQALTSMLGKEIKNQNSLQEILTAGIKSYHQIIAGLDSQLGYKPGDHLSWPHEAEEYFKDSLRSEGPLISYPLESDEQQVYLKTLQDLAGYPSPIGAIMLVGPEFYSLTIQKNDEGKIEVLIFDSHGSARISEQGESPTFLAKCTSLQQAARFLALRRQFDEEESWEYNQVTLYPMSLVGTQKSSNTPFARGKVNSPEAMNIEHILNLDSEAFNKTLKPSLEHKQKKFPFLFQDMSNENERSEYFEKLQAEIPSKSATAKEKLAQKMIECEISLSKIPFPLPEQSLDKYSEEIVNTLTLFFKDFIYPAVFQESQETRGLAIQMLDGWLREVIPALFTYLPMESKTSSQSQDFYQYTTKALRCLTTFFHDYQAVVDKEHKEKTGWTTRWFYNEPTNVQEREERFLTSITQMRMNRGEVIHSMDEKKVLGELIDKLLQLYGSSNGALNPSLVSEVKKYGPEILSELINTLLSPEFVRSMMEGFIEDDDLTQSIKDFSSSQSMSEDTGIVEEIPKEFTEAFTELASTFIDLGEPKWSAYFISVMGKKLLSRVSNPQKATQVIVSLSKIFSQSRVSKGMTRLLGSMTSVTKPQEKVDVLPLFFHLFKEYRWNDNESKEIKERTLNTDREISKKLYGKILGIVKNAIPYYSDKLMSISEYTLPSVHQFATTFTENIVTLTQSPKLLKFFIYQDLIHNFMIPEIDRQLPSIPPEVVNDPHEQTKIAQLIGKEGTEFIQNYVRDYLAGSYVNQKNPLMKALFEFIVQSMGETLPPILAESLGSTPQLTPEGQNLLVNVYGSLSDFVVDYGKANAKIKKHPQFELWNPERKELELLSALSLVREQRGAPSLKTSEEEMDLKLSALSKFFVDEATKGFSSNQKAIANAVSSLAPKILKEIFEIMVSPQVINLLLERGFLFSMKSTEEVEEDVTPQVWDEQSVVRWNQTLLNFMAGAASLLQPENNMEHMLHSLLQTGVHIQETRGKDIATFTGGPDKFLAPSKTLSLFRVLNSVLWKEGEDGKLERAVKDPFKLSQEELESLRSNLHMKAKAFFFDQLLKTFSKSELVQKGMEMLGFSFLESIEKISGSFCENLFEILQSKRLLQALVYNYLMEDITPHIIRVMDKKKYASDSTLLRSMPTNLQLDMTGGYWEIKESQLPKEKISSNQLIPGLVFTGSEKDTGIQYKHYLEEMGELMQTVKKSPSLTTLLHILSKWMKEERITAQDQRALLNSLENPEEFKEITARIIGSSPSLSEKEIQFLFKHLQKGEFAFVFLYLDQKTASENEGLAKWIELHPSSLEYAIDREDLQDILSMYKLSSSMQRWIDSIQKKYPEVFRDVNLEELISFEEEISEKEQLVHAFSIIVKFMQKNAENLEAADQRFIQEMAGQLNTHDDSYLYLEKLFGVLDQIEFWQEFTEQQRVTIEQIQNKNTCVDVIGELRPAYNALYENLGQILPKIVHTPLSQEQQSIITESFLAQMHHFDLKNIPKNGEMYDDCSMYACSNAKESNEKKLQLIEQAENSVVMSGCYLGGEIFDAALDMIQNKLRENPLFVVKIIGTDTMIETSNLKRIELLSEEFPERFDMMITPELKAYKSRSTGNLSSSANHVKALVIDNGKAFVIGGSGMVDRWANFTGEQDQTTQETFHSTMPLAFRDVDFVFTDNKGLMGRRIQMELLDLMSIWSVSDPDEITPSRFSSRFHSIPNSSQEQFSLENTESSSVAFYPSGPNDRENAFLKELIKGAEEAKESIVIGHMYFHATPELLKALIDASNRGVRITIITNRSGFDMPALHLLYTNLSRKNWKQIFEGKEKENVKVYEYNVTNTTYHKKVVLIDDETLYTGSGNIGYKSMEGLSDFEYNLKVESKMGGRQVRSQLEQDMSLSKQVPTNEAAASEITSDILGPLHPALKFFL